MAVYCIGDIRADITADIRGGGFADVVTDLGGTGANVAMLIAKFGLHTVMLGTVADDPTGRFLLGQLRDSDVDTSCIRVTEAGFFPTLVITENGTVTGAAPWILPDTRYDTIGDIDYSCAAPAAGDIVHTTGACIESDPGASDALLTFLEKAKKSGALISFDINSREHYFGASPERISILETIASMSDILTGSYDEFRLLAGDRTFTDAFSDSVAP